MEKEVKEMEVKFIDHVTKTSESLKKLNYTNQKTYENKTKLTNLDNKLVSLEKKHPPTTATSGMSDSSKYIVWNS